ncbi:hypothetical protein [Paenibacillus graminis]|uniref:hypothetical protein n=1 Tax=Paenibacillus graminis TaxID=189425 RepID=UPI002DBCB2DF|nr:hypothetical protein [Paenibacillus graminis]MEC0167840.1 hypothetical protein [Paenibacillus graminis]
MILPMVQAAFERDSLVFLSLRTPDPYVDWLYAARERLSLKARMVKYNARQRSITVTKQQRVAGGILVRYQCRGYFGDITLSNAEIAQEAAGLMRKYLTFDYTEQ